MQYNNMYLSEMTNQKTGLKRLAQLIRKEVKKRRRSEKPGTKSEVETP